MERETVVCCGFWLLNMMVLPKLLVLEDNFFEILESDDHRVDLAQFAKFEKLDGWDALTIAGEVNENYRNMKLEILYLRSR